MAKVEYCVIGYGDLGCEICRQIKFMGKRLMIIENNPSLIDRIGREYEIAIKCDATDINALADTGVKNVENVIVALHSNLAASILICANLKQLGCSNIIARAKNLIHERILKSIGITNVIIPEIQSAQRITSQLIYHKNTNVMPLDKDLYLIKLVLTNPKLINKKIVDIDFQSRYATKIVAIKRKNTQIFPLTLETEFKLGDVVTIITAYYQISKLIKFFNN